MQLIDNTNCGNTLLFYKQFYQVSGGMMLGFLTGVRKAKNLVKKTITIQYLSSL